MWLVGILRCEQCGCSSDEQARGWVAFLGDDPDGLEPTCAYIFCPVCATEQFGYRPDRADAYT